MIIPDGGGMAGVIADVGLDPDDFPLESTIDDGDVRCTIEQFVTTDSDRLTVFLWVEGDLKGIEDSLEADDTVDRVTRVIDHDDRRLYRMDWVGRIDPLVRFVVEEEGAVISANGTDDGWRLRLLCSSREDLSRLYDYCRDNGIDVEVHTLYNVNEGREGQFDLTAQQEETLLAALDRGYYDIPRKVDLEELAAEFGVSHQALSERLRRAHGTLVGNALTRHEESRDDQEADTPMPSDSTHSR